MSLPVNIHTHVFTSGEVLEILSNDFQNVAKKSDQIDNHRIISIGVHPLFLSDFGKFNSEEFQKLILNSGATAIGESGLDKNSPLTTEEQLTIFRKQMIVSKNLKMPIIIHCVGRWGELEKLFKERKENDPKWIIHGFRKIRLSDKFLNLGAYLSFGKAILFDSSLQSCIQNVPLNRIFLETDDADVDLMELYEKLAEIKSLPLPAVTEQLYQNFLEVFHHGKLA